ncbi:MAG TPA: hypothetical protein VLS90_14530, partial [Thermodesulfobacteriota bacterium]|nr:hypothetical protein [Thermodesulfobacteriota bacterium]
MSENFRVIKPEHQKSLPSQKFVPPLICGEAMIPQMLRPVNLDNEFRDRGKKIQNVVSQRPLPVKLDSQDLLPPELLPE